MSWSRPNTTRPRSETHTYIFFASIIDRGQGPTDSRDPSGGSADPVQRRLGTIGAYALVNLSAGLVSKDDRYRITFQVRNLFDKAFAAAIANGGPDGAYLYQIPRDADRYFGVTGHVGF